MVVVAARIPQLELDNQLCFALYDASRAVVRAYGPLLDELGLTYPQYITMLVLWEADSPLSMGDLGSRLHLDSGTLTPLVKRLVHLGVVERRRDPADERRVLVTLTEQGTALRQHACDVPARIFGRFGMDVDAARALRDDLTRIVQSIESGPATPS
jgi:DNA-binding MarR family transcriptional regulator